MNAQHPHLFRGILLMWSTLLAFLAFGDFPDPGSLLGMLVIAGAGLLSINWKNVRQRSEAARGPAVHINARRRQS